MHSQFENIYYTKTCSGSEGSYWRLIDFVNHSTSGLKAIEREHMHGPREKPAREIARLGRVEKVHFLRAPPPNVRNYHSSIGPEDSPQDPLRNCALQAEAIDTPPQLHTNYGQVVRLVRPGFEAAIRPGYEALPEIRVRKAPLAA